jgi:hypothetical protein
MILTSMQLEAIRPEEFSRGLTKVKRRIDRLCKKNFCRHVRFSGFPPRVAITRSGLLDFLSIASARSVDIQASGAFDFQYVLRLQEMEQAVDLLRSGKFDREIATQ